MTELTIKLWQLATCLIDYLYCLPKARLWYLLLVRESKQLAVLVVCLALLRLQFWL